MTELHNAMDGSELTFCCEDTTEVTDSELLLNFPTVSEVPKTGTKSLLASCGLSKSELHEKAAAFRACAEVKNRKYLLRTFKDCFVASETIDAMVANGLADNREAAVQLGRLLATELNLFHHVCDDHEFTDAHLFFRFWYHEDIDKGKDEKTFNLLKKAINNPVRTATKCTKTAVKTVNSLRESLIAPEQATEDTEKDSSDMFTEETPDPTVSLTDSEPDSETPTALELGYNTHAELGYNKELDSSEILRSSTHQRRDISRGMPECSSRSSNRRVSRGVRTQGSRVRRQRSSSFSGSLSAVKQDHPAVPAYQRQRSNSFSGGSKSSSLIQNDDVLKPDPSILPEADPVDSVESNSPTQDTSRCQMEDRSSIIKRQRNKRESSKKTPSKAKSKRMPKRSTSFNLDTSSSAQESQTKRSSKSSRLPKRVTSGPTKSHVPMRELEDQDCADFKTTEAPNNQTKRSSRSSRSPKRVTSGPTRSSIPMRELEDLTFADFKTAEAPGNRKMAGEEGIKEEAKKQAKKEKPKERTSISKLCDGIAHLAATAENANNWSCSGCGEEHLHQHTFCGMCGLKRQEPPTCWECNLCGTKDNKGRYRFCAGCGSSRTQATKKTDEMGGNKKAPAAA